MSETNTTCFWCSQDMPKPINNYTPCKGCIEKMEKGIVIIEVQDIRMQPFQPSLIIPSNYPTGTWFILRENTIYNLFDYEVANKVLVDKIVFLDRPMLENLGLRMKENQVSTVELQ